MSRCMVFPPPGYLWNGLSGQALVQKLHKVNAERERKKQKMRREEEKKEKRRRKLETVEHRRKCRDNFFDNLQIIKRRKATEWHPDYGQHETFCAYWIFSFKHSDIDVGFLSELKKCMHQVLSSKKIDILHQSFSAMPSFEFHSPSEKLDLKSEVGTLLMTEMKYKELILNWVPTPLDTANTDLGDEQWLYDREELKKNYTNQKISAGHDLFCYPYTTILTLDILKSSSLGNNKEKLLGRK